MSHKIHILHIKPNIKFVVYLILLQTCSPFCILYFIHTSVHKYLLSLSHGPGCGGGGGGGGGSAGTRHGPGFPGLCTGPWVPAHFSEGCSPTPLCILALVTHQVLLVSPPKCLSNTSTQSPTRPEVIVSTSRPHFPSLFGPLSHFLNTFLFWQLLHFETASCTLSG